MEGLIQQVVLPVVIGLALTVAGWRIAVRTKALPSVARMRVSMCEALDSSPDGLTEEAWLRAAIEKYNHQMEGGDFRTLRPGRAIRRKFGAALETLQSERGPFVALGPDGRYRFTRHGTSKWRQKPHDDLQVWLTQAIEDSPATAVAPGKPPAQMTPPEFDPLILSALANGPAGIDELHARLRNAAGWQRLSKKTKTRIGRRLNLLIRDGRVAEFVGDGGESLYRTKTGAH